MHLFLKPTNMKTNTGREIKVRGNKAKRTFTIRTSEGFKYRTLVFGKDEFKNASYWTANDWQIFLNRSSYYYNIR